MPIPTRLHTFVTAARVPCALALALFAAACASDRSSLTDPAARKSISISFATRPVIATGAGQLNAPLNAPPNAPLVRGDVLAAGGMRPSAALQAVSGADTLVVTRVQLVLSRVELTRSVGVACDGDSSSPECSEIEQKFVLVDLPTDSTVRTALASDIAPGTYSSLEARIRVPRTSDDPNAAAFLAAHPELAGANVHVEGTFRGKPFSYSGAVDTRFELEFSPPLVVDASGANITVHVDVTTWFRGGSGQLVDPATANSGGSNASLVASNIRRSFRAVRDDRRDGHDDGDKGDGKRG
ncbi:MAG TPA: hypothetical protein VGT98_01000 [Candidatus Elarobacter sp.]|nr:hypothetical protein [Candidatus Elarobacter sp.]